MSPLDADNFKDLHHYFLKITLEELNFASRFTYRLRLLFHEQFNNIGLQYRFFELEKISEFDLHTFSFYIIEL
jgi:hypothetical protein